MKVPSFRTPRRSLCAVLTACALVGGGALAARADDPASIGEPGGGSARKAFQRFAQDWMKKVRKLEEENRRNPTVRPGAGGTISTYRGYGDDFSIELRPTGRAVAPYIGLLRYTELTYSGVGETCSVASRSPVTEIFRFQDGRWVY